MLYYAAFGVVMLVLITVIRGDAEREPGPVRSILMFAVMFVPLGFGEYRGSLRRGEPNAWVAIPLYIVAGFIAGCALWLIERRRRRRPRKPAGNDAA